MTGLIGLVLFSNGYRESAPPGFHFENKAGEMETHERRRSAGGCTHSSSSSYSFHCRPLPLLQELPHHLTLPTLVPKQSSPLIQGGIHLGKSSPKMEGKPANRPKNLAAVGSNSQCTGICMTLTVQMSKQKRISQIRIRPIMHLSPVPKFNASSRRRSSIVDRIDMWRCGQTPPC